MMNLTQHFTKSKPSTFVVACSGGVDSMVMLDMLHKTLASNKEKIHVVYVDHGQRKSVVKDKSVIKKYCSKNKLKYKLFKLKIKKNASEQELRKKRYEVLFNYIKTLNDAVLLTAHHQDDQLETLFFRILRGAHPDSLMGISFVSKRQSVKILRPLLEFSKEEIIKYAKKFKIEWSEDETNLSTQFSRNLIRNVIFKDLNKVHPGALKNLNKFLTEISKQNFQKTELLMNSVQENIQDFTSKNGIEVKKITFDALKKLIDQVLEDFSSRTTKSHWISLRNHLEQRRATKLGGGPEKIIQFPGGNFVQFKGNRLFWNKA